MRSFLTLSSLAFFLAAISPASHADDGCGCCQPEMVAVHGCLGGRGISQPQAEAMWMGYCEGDCRTGTAEVKETYFNRLFYGGFAGGNCGGGCGVHSGFGFPTRSSCPGDCGVLGRGCRPASGFGLSRLGCRAGSACCNSCAQPAADSADPQPTPDAVVPQPQPEPSTPAQATTFRRMSW